MRRQEHPISIRLGCDLANFELVENCATPVVCNNHVHARGVTNAWLHHEGANIVQESQVTKEHPRHTGCRGGLGNAPGRRDSPIYSRKPAVSENRDVFARNY